MELVNNVFSHIGYIADRLGNFCFRATVSVFLLLIMAFFLWVSCTLLIGLFSTVSLSGLLNELTTLWNMLF